MGEIRNKHGYSAAKTHLKVEEMTPELNLRGG
jgi:hypothetical protein